MIDRNFQAYRPRGLLFFAIFAAGIVTAGCQGDKDEPAVTQPFKGQTVTVAVPAGLDFPDYCELTLTEWSARTAATGQLQEIDFSSGNSSVADVVKANLVLFPVTEIAAFGEAGLLRPISKAQQANDVLAWNDIYKGLRETVGSLRDGPAVVPLSSPVLILYYRQDLLEKAGLSPPKSWSDYQKLADKLDEWAPGKTIVEPWCEEFRATMFLARAVSSVKHPSGISTFFDISTGEPLIDGPGFQRALERAVATVNRMPADVLEFDPYDCRRELFVGRAAMAIAFETGPGNPILQLVPARNRGEAPSPISDVESRQDDWKIGFSRLPGAQEVYNRTTKTWEPGRSDGVNFATLTAFGGLCAAVTANNSDVQADASWNLFVALSGGEDGPPAFPPGTLTSCRRSQSATVGLWVGDELGPFEAGQYVAAVANSLDDENQVAELPVIARNEFRLALTETLTTVLKDPSQASRSLKDVAGKWREISDRHGTEKVRDSYRRCLGLRAIGTQD